MARSIRLLWLDPDDLTVNAGKQSLVQQGWKVDQAHNLVEALDCISQRSYDAIIMDLQLPDALGTDAWVHVRRLAPGIAGILTTSSSSLFSLVRVDSTGLAAYLHKPLSIPDVISLLCDALGISGSAPASDRSVVQA